MAQTETGIYYRQVARVDGPGEYRLLADARTGLLLPPPTPFTEFNTLALLLDDEIIDGVLSYTEDLCIGSRDLGDELSGAGRVNVLSTGDSHTEVAVDISWHGLMGPPEVMLDIDDIGEPKITNGTLLFHPIRVHDGRFSLTVRAWSEQSPWGGKIKVEGSNRGPLVEESINRFNFIVSDIEATLWRQNRLC